MANIEMQFLQYKDGTYKHDVCIEHNEDRGHVIWLDSSISIDLADWLNFKKSVDVAIDLYEKALMIEQPSDE